MKSRIAGRALFWSIVVHCGVVLPFLLGVSLPVALPQKPVIAVEIIGGASLPDGIAGALVAPASSATPASAARQPVAAAWTEKSLEVAEVENTSTASDFWDEVPLAEDAALFVPQPTLPKVKPAEKKTVKQKSITIPEPPLPKPKPRLVAFSEQEVPPEPVESEPIESKQVEPVLEYEKTFDEQAVTFAYANPQAAESGGGGDGGAGDHETYPQYEGVGLANPLPVYPYKARKKGQQGRVILRVAVTPSGAVGSIEVLDSSGYRLLDRAARNAIERWRFQPATRAGIAIAGFVDVPVTFKLSEN